MLKYNWRDLMTITLKVSDNTKEEMIKYFEDKDNFDD